MYKVIQTIKGSRAIVILLILYVTITIAVVALDRSLSHKKDNKESTETKENNNNNNNNQTKDDLSLFVSEVNNLYEDIDDYVIKNNITTNQCIPLESMLGSAVDGSVLLSENGTRYFVWYGNGKYVINGVELNGSSIKKNDAVQSFTTPYYNNCGMNQ